jgi:hypothetical protein
MDFFKFPKQLYSLLTLNLGTVVSSVTWLSDMVDNKAVYLTPEMVVFSDQARISETT